jgi:hypothetical protein
VIIEPSRMAPRCLSDLLRNGTPPAKSNAELLDRFAAHRSELDETAELAFAAHLARHGPIVPRVPGRARRSARSRRRLSGDVFGFGGAGAIDPTPGLGSVVTTRRGAARPDRSGLAYGKATAP